MTSTASIHAAPPSAPLPSPPLRLPWRAAPAVHLPPLLRLLVKRCGLEPAVRAFTERLASFRWAAFYAAYPLHRRPLPPPLDATAGELLLLALFSAAAASQAAAAYTAGGGGGDDDRRRRRLDDDGVDASGGLADVTLGLAFATAARNSLAAALLGLPFERALGWHKLLAAAAVALGLYHGLLSAEWDRSGAALQAAMLGLVATSLPPIRRTLFNAFYAAHLALVGATLAFALAHGASASFFGVCLWLLDLAIRAHMVTFAYAGHAAEATLLRLPAGVVRISFPRVDARGTPLLYSGGQYVFLCLPALSLLEWHPFSLSSSPSDETVTIHVRVLGDWTCRLHQLAADVPTRATCLFEGPYGAPSVDVASSRHRCFLLLSGGIGITPMQSVANELLATHAQGRPLAKLWFVWSVRDSSLVSSLFAAPPRDARLPLASAPPSHLPPPPPPPSKPATPRLPLSFQPDTLHALDIDPALQAELSRREAWRAAADSAAAAAAPPPPPPPPPSSATVHPAPPPSSRPILHTEFYLTRCRDASGFADANIRPELQPFLRFGRPNLRAIFETMRAAAAELREADVAVLACGPAAMVREARGLAAELSDVWCAAEGGVRFHFHSELFEF